MVKPTNLPRYTNFFSPAERAFTGWLASHPRSLLTGAESGASRTASETELAGRSILAGGDEPGDRPGKKPPLPNARCDLLSRDLQQARAVAAQADVMRQNWQSESESRARELERINAQLDAIFARLQDIDREHGEREFRFEPGAVTDARKAPQRDKSWSKGVGRTTGGQVIVTTLDEYMSRAQAEGKKSAHAEQTRELLRERGVVEEYRARAEANRRREEASFQAASEHIEAIERQMTLHGCSIPPHAQG
ncbi:MAG: hypothetical protein HOP13_17945 [Alphaproteobacteria bacterium]|nr:hypothetical protein [Alphaproteobacteria bacterium]